MTDTPAASKDASTDEALLEAATADAKLEIARIERIAPGHGSRTAYAILLAHVATLTAKLEAERAAKENAISTLKAWFDRRKLAHEQVDQAVLDAAKGYLRRSRVGGMSTEESDAIEVVIGDMVRLSIFADLFARATLAQPADGDGGK